MFLDNIAATRVPRCGRVDRLNRASDSGKSVAVMYGHGRERRDVLLKYSLYICMYICNPWSREGYRKVKKPDDNSSFARGPIDISKRR